MGNRNCPWKHLQPSTSIFKYSPTSRKPFLIFFSQMQLHLHMGLTILLSLDLYVYFFATKLALLLEKKNEMVIWDSSWTPDGLFFSMIQAQPHGSPQKRGQHFFFIPPVHWGTATSCVSFCMYCPDVLWIFFKLSIMLFTLLWWEDREFLPPFRRGTVLCKSCFPCKAQIWMWRFLAAPFASCITPIDCFLFLISQ